MAQMERKSRNKFLTWLGIRTLDLSSDQSSTQPLYYLQLVENRSHKSRKIWSDVKIESERDIERQRQRDRERERERQRHRQTQRQTEKQAEEQKEKLHPKAIFPPTVSHPCCSAPTSVTKAVRENTSKAVISLARLMWASEAGMRNSVVFFIKTCTSGHSSYHALLIKQNVHHFIYESNYFTPMQHEI